MENIHLLGLPSWQWLLSKLYVSAIPNGKLPVGNRDAPILVGRWHLARVLVRKLLVGKYYLPTALGGPVVNYDLFRPLPVRHCQWETLNFRPSLVGRCYTPLSGETNIDWKRCSCNRTAADDLQRSFVLCILRMDGKRRISGTPLWFPGSPRERWESRF